MKGPEPSPPHHLCAAPVSVGRRGRAKPWLHRHTDRSSPALKSWQPSPQCAWEMHWRKRGKWAESLRPGEGPLAWRWGGCHWVL